MIKFMNALREKHRTPQAACRALGLDEALLRENDKEPMDEREKAIRAGLKLAQDASLSEITDFLKAVTASEGGGASEVEAGFGEHEDDGEDEIPGAVTEPNAGLPAGVEGEEHEGEGVGEEVAHDEPAAAIHAILKDKCSPEELAQIGELLEAIAAPEGDDDEDDSVEGEEHGEPAPGEHEGEDEDSEEDTTEGEDEDEEDMTQGNKEQFVAKPAMDAAIAAAVADAEKRAFANSKAIREAERAVRPYVGELAMDAASAEQVYRKALSMLNVDGHDKVEAKSLPYLLRQVQLPGSNHAPRRESRLAQDAAADEGFAKRFPRLVALPN
jgi:hypothetical protein